MLINLLFKHQPQLVMVAPVFRAVLEQVNDPANLSLLQAFILASSIYGLEPDLILDLGTGMGNSAAIFGLIAERVGADVSYVRHKSKLGDCLVQIKSAIPG